MEGEAMTDSAERPAVLKKVFKAPVLSRRRIWLAFAIAVAADGIQLVLGPMGWAFVDQGIDFAAMILISLLIGFHPLFLPTFVAEFIPAIDMLPTWTACVALVMARRWKTARPTTPTEPPGRPDVIDV